MPETQEEITSFSEIVNPASSYKGRQVKFADLIDKQIVLRACTVMPSRIYPNSEFVIISASLDGEDIVTMTGSKVIREQLGKISMRFPITTVVTKVKNYYTFK